MIGREEKRKVYPWGTTRRFNSYSDYLRRIYGGRLQKVSIDAGFTCPNRDGTKGTGGCSFCNNKAFNPSYCNPSKSITQQLKEGIEFLNRRYRRAAGFLAYFQAYSNTYAPLDKLMKLYDEALSFPGIKGLVIGTRPDCIDEEKIRYLSKLAKKYYIVVEYGIESCYDKTLKLINRGHSFSDSVKAVKMTASAGIATGAHFIIGLPGETRDDLLKEAGIISSLPLHMAKFHQLQIIKGTQIEKEYLKNPHMLHLFTFEEYVDFFIEFLERLNPDIIVERFTGEAPPRMLAVRNWNNRRSDQIIPVIEKRMEELNTWQGKRYRKNSYKVLSEDKNIRNN